METLKNEKKHFLMPTGPLRKALRAFGHHLDPVLNVGKEGVTEAVVKELDAQIRAHELVKVKVLAESPESRFLAAELLGKAAGAQVAQVLGRTALLYRNNPDRSRFEAAPAKRVPDELPGPAKPAFAKRRPHFSRAGGPAKRVPDERPRRAKRAFAERRPHPGRAGGAAKWVPDERPRPAKRAFAERRPHPGRAGGATKRVPDERPRPAKRAFTERRPHPGRAGKARRTTPKGRRAKT